MTIKITLKYFVITRVTFMAKLKLSLHKCAIHFQKCNRCFGLRIERHTELAGC